MNSTDGGRVQKQPPRAQHDSGEIPDDPRLMQAVQEYLHQLEAGKAPQRQEFLRRYPEIVGPLTLCLDGLELVHTAAIRKKEPASGPAPSPAGSSDPLPGNPLGDFQIMREIGRGGMGIVYEALQLSLGRLVALKVLPFAATFDARHLQRFHNEAKAAANLHHTNIVPVYAVDCERGVHFYAMQLIEGQSLATLIQQIKRQEAGRRQESGAREQQPSLGTATAPFRLASDSDSLNADVAAETASPLSLALTTQRSNQHAKFFPTLARFMVQAAEAVEYAHQSGIVHRDIKPANLLVDVHNRLWITDFGLAQFHADAGLTQTGDILGTLRYMSPEQASGTKVLDHRTDVYSLGATLYELVTLEPIFPGRNRQELLHQIINDEPRPPRALEKTIPVELETIILKAVSKNVADRYGSAQEFANDLQCYLDDKPILAKRPSMVERARKWSRRHPSIVAASVLILVVCVVGLMVSTWMVSREQAKTQAALKNEKERAAQARRAVDLLVEVSEGELAEKPFLEEVRRRLLETALEYYETFIDAQGADGAEQADLVRGKQRLSSILDELATLQGARLIGLAINKDVQNDMNLDDEQRDELANLHARASEQRAARLTQERWLTPEARRQKSYELAKIQEGTLSDVLQPQQLLRLKQIELQQQGPRAFRESYAVGVLKLTKEQRQEIRKISVRAMAAIAEGREKNRDKGKNNLVKRVQRAEVEEILKILAPEQKARWQDLTGAPFRGFVGRPPPPPGQGPAQATTGDPPAPSVCNSPKKKGR